MTSVTINAPTNTTVGAAFQATANPSGGVKAMSAGVNVTFTAEHELPYPFSIEYLDGSQVSMAAYINDSDEPDESVENPNWLYDVNGVLLFDVNKKLLEVM